MKRHNSYVNGVREVCANKTEPQRGCVSAVTCVDRAAYQGTCVHPGLVRGEQQQARATTPHQWYGGQKRGTCRQMNC